MDCGSGWQGQDGRSGGRGAAVARGCAQELGMTCVVKRTETRMPCQVDNNSWKPKKRRHRPLCLLFFPQTSSPFSFPPPACLRVRRRADVRATSAGRKTSLTAFNHGPVLELGLEPNVGFEAGHSAGWIRRFALPVDAITLCAVAVLIPLAVSSWRRGGDGLSCSARASFPARPQPPATRPSLAAAHL
jgi:hypothetical protein